MCSTAPEEINNEGKGSTDRRIHLTTTQEIWCCWMSWEKVMSPIKIVWKMLELELEKYFWKNLQEIDYMTGKRSQPHSKHNLFMKVKASWGLNWYFFVIFQLSKSRSSELYWELSVSVPGPLNANELCLSTPALPATHPSQGEDAANASGSMC